MLLSHALFKNDAWRHAAHLQWSLLCTMRFFLFVFGGNKKSQLEFMNGPVGTGSLEVNFLVLVPILDT